MRLGYKSHNYKRLRGRKFDVSHKMQRRLLSLLVLAISQVLNRPLRNLVADLVPERRGPVDDATEAILQGMARVVAVIVASAVVRGLTESRK